MAKAKLSDVYLDPDPDMRRHLNFDIGLVAKMIAQARGDGAPSAFARDEAQAAILAVLTLQRRAQRDARYFAAAKKEIRTPDGGVIRLRGGARYRLRSGAEAVYEMTGPRDPWLPLFRDHMFRVVTGPRAGRVLTVRFDGRHAPLEMLEQETEFDVVGPA